MHTRDRLLDMAERLFSRKGIEAVSLRELKDKAGVNIAAVHYHFGGRRELIHAVLERRVTPLNAARVRLLEAVEAGHPPAPAPLPLEEVLHAFVGPVFELLEKRPQAAWLIACVQNSYDDELRKFHLGLFAPLVARFQSAFVRALPPMPPEAGWSRMQFVWGSMIYMMTRKQRRDTIGEGVPRELPAAELAATWVAFCAAGLRSGGAPRPNH